MTNKLKPGPFCGSTEIYASPHIAVVMCKKCRCWWPNTCITSDQAIEAWNRRAEDK